MEDKENVETYFNRLDEIVNTMRVLGEEVEELMIVQKFIRYLHLIFDSKVCAIEEMKDIDKLTMD
jgi:hypothetical protein